MNKPNKRRRNSKRIIGIIFILLLIIGGYGGKLYYSNFVKPNVLISDESVFLFIPRNATQETVLQLVKDLNILEDPESLDWVTQRKNYQGSNIVPGKYELVNGMTNNQLINHLRAGNGRLEVKIQFAQQRNIAQLAGRFAKEIKLDSLSIYEWLDNPDSIAKFGFNAQTITSMFVPNTYFMDWDATVPELMRRMAREYKKFWNEERRQKAEAIGLSQSEVVTMASIVYWETKAPKDKPIIAGVYMNRIRLGMPLQADPTLIFALDDYSIRRVLNVHKEIDSPYNTYKNRGLPPGPILIPPISYIDAVLNYTRHDFLYFVAKEDFSGDSYFAETYSQHIVYARRFQRALNKRGIYR